MSNITPKDFQHKNSESLCDSDPRPVKAQVGTDRRVIARMWDTHLGLMGRSPDDSNQQQSPYPEKLFQQKSKMRTVEPQKPPPQIKQNYTVKGRVVLLPLHPRRGWECSNCSGGPRWRF
eukprot:superscaffoldBa00014495_g26362